MAIQTETRDVRGFNSVEMRGFGELIVVQRDIEEKPGEEEAESVNESLVIEADESLLPRIFSRVENGRLILGLDTPWWDIMSWIQFLTVSKKARYTVTMSQVNGFTINGSGTVTGENIRSEACHLTISGSGKMTFPGFELETLRSLISGSGEYHLSGKAERHEARISGSGKIQAAEFVTESTQAIISGSGYAEVNCEDELDVSISGSGEVRYRGEPAVRKSVSGSGKVAPLGK
jgi:hypothetical protein